MHKQELTSQAVRFSVEEEGTEVGRAYLYLIKNDLHDAPYGLLEDVFVDESQRGKGYGRKLVEAVVEEARSRGCYKVIGQSRYGRDDVHALYERIGFQDHGKNFRMDF